MNTMNATNGGRRSGRFLRPVLRALVASLLLGGLCLAPALLGRHQCVAQVAPSDFIFRRAIEKLINPMSVRDLWVANAKKGQKNLSGAQMSIANLSGVDLKGANLTGADLTAANLSKANLTGADLNTAQLSFADLTGADLTGANLSHANLSKANLSGAVADKTTRGIDIGDWKKRGGIFKED